MWSKRSLISLIILQLPPQRGLCSVVPPRGCCLYETNLDCQELQTLDGCVLPTQASAIEELHDWSLNFETGLNPYCLFIDLIGYSADRWGSYMYMHKIKNCGEIFGYKELCLLADALKIFENNGYEQVYAWCDLLNESEDC